MANELTRYRVHVHHVSASVAIDIEAASPDAAYAAAVAKYKIDKLVFTKEARLNLCPDAVICDVVTEED